MRASDAPAGETAATLYVFADETGDDRFDAAGSRYFGIAAVVTTDPVTTATAAHELLYELQAEGVSRRTDRDDPITSLHATYDPPHVRERVLAMIDGLVGSFRVHLSYMDKRKLNPSIRSRERMYGIVASAVATYIAKQAASRRYRRIVFAFDQALNKKEQSAFKAAVKPKLKATGVPYTLLFHQLGHEPNGQIADYIAWAWSRMMERGDDSYLCLMPRVASILTPFDVFRRGTKRYYK